MRLVTSTCRAFDIAVEQIRDALGDVQGVNVILFCKAKLSASIIKKNVQGEHEL